MLSFFMGGRSFAFWFLFMFFKKNISDILDHHLYWVCHQYIYSQTCIKRSPLGQRKSGLIRQVTSLKRFNSYEIFYDRTRKMGPFNTGDCLIEVTAWAGLTFI